MAATSGYRGWRATLRIITVYIIHPGCGTLCISLLAGPDRLVSRGRSGVYLTLPYLPLLWAAAYGFHITLLYLPSPPTVSFGRAILLETIVSKLCFPFYNSLFLSHLCSTLSPVHGPFLHSQPRHTYQVTQDAPVLYPRPRHLPRLLHPYHHLPGLSCL